MTSQRMSQIYSPALTTVWIGFPCAAISHLAKPVGDCCLGGAELLAVPCDVQQLPDVQRLVTETIQRFGAASRLLWKIEKAYSLGIPKKQLAHGVSQTEEEHAYARRYTIWW